MKDTACIVLAAGKGTRMKQGAGAKVLRKAAGRPLLAWVLDAVFRAGMENILVVVGHDAEKVKSLFNGRGLTFVLQEEQLGTGHAVLSCREALEGFSGDVLIVCGDHPLLTPEVLTAFMEGHRKSRAMLSVLTVELEEPGGYGRIVRDTTGGLAAIVEAKDADEDILAVREVNTGVFAVDAGFLFSALESVKNHNVQGEYYLTDIVKIGRKRGAAMSGVKADDPACLLGVNTEDELLEAERSLLKRGATCAG